MIKPIQIFCLAILTVCGLSATGGAEGGAADTPEKDRFPADYHKALTGPPAGKAIRKYADGRLWFYETAAIISLSETRIKLSVLSNRNSSPDKNYQFNLRASKFPTDSCGKCAPAGS